MSAFKRVTAHNRCPICGKPDWCFWIQMSGYDGELLCCQRHTTKEDVLGMDGQYYIHVKFSEGDGSSGASIFEEAGQRRARLENFKNEKNAERDFKKAQTRERVLTPVGIIEPKNNAELDKVYRAMLNLLTLEPMHREYLHKEGWTDEMIEKYQIRSFPEKDFQRFNYRKESFKAGNLSRKKLAARLIEQFGENALIGVPGAFKDKNGVWTFNGRSGIIFPQYDVYHRLYRIRIRMDFRDVNAPIVPGNGVDDHYVDQQGKVKYISMGGIYELVDEPMDGQKRVYDKSGGKYRNFSSFKQDEEAEKQGILMNLFDSGCEACNQLGFYYTESRDDMHICYVTEGEKKGIFANEILRAPFVSVPGVSSWQFLLSKKNGERPIDVLKAKGVKILIVAFDADREENKRVMAAQNATIEALKKEGFTVGVAEWDMSLGKGIDDLLANGNKPKYVLG